MKNNKNAFTLIELLSVIVIFAITFLIVVPTMNSLIGSGEKREIELIEEKVLSAAKEYVNNFDGSFYKNFYKEGDTSYVYKSDLISAGLIDENEVSRLNTFAGVKGELLSNDRIRYTVEYINASNNVYTNEELYLMIQNLQKQDNNSDSSCNINSETIEDLQNQIDTNTMSISNLTNKENTNNVFLQNYPVGSIYISENNTNPGTKFGGTWVSYGSGRTLVGVDSSQTEFATVGFTGGEKTHTLTTDEMPSHGHGGRMYITGYSGWEIQTINNFYVFDLTSGFIKNTAIEEITTNIGFARLPSTDNTGSSEPHNNLQPYITVYMWKRTA